MLSKPLVFINDTAGVYGVGMALSVYNAGYPIAEVGQAPAAPGHSCCVPLRISAHLR
ncbi:hypothetical protein BQ8482_111289 [Mesorhizobium delmotii]|uniref:Uncharacterized protein n=1 Tax=Mesorhizobium delmotii TaxID=1631247 RepID=A0A2P9ADZ2_9HYPH|nr:hypothetical protein BQ8482_111289 [Mesorhizobium delmotii]